MANLKSTVISGNGQFTASRLIGNADTASALQIITLTEENIDTYCTKQGSYYNTYDLMPGKYTCTISESFEFDSLYLLTDNNIITVTQIGDDKIVEIETKNSIRMIGEDSPQLRPFTIVKTNRNSETVLYWVPISFPEIDHITSYTVNESITITPGSPTYMMPIGTNLTITANPETNYRINSITLNGTQTTGDTGIIELSKWINTIAVDVELDQVSLTVTKPTGASIAINDTAVTQDSQVFAFTPGDSVHVVVTAEEGYNVTNITLNGETIAADYTFNISGATTLVVAASIKMYNVKVFHPEHGTITVNGDTQNEYTFPHGSSLLIDVIPEEGWYVDRVDISQPGDIFHITTEGSDASTYTITVNGEPINPDGYAAGTECAVVVTPAEGYDVTAVTRSGYEFAANDSFFINYDNVINVTTSPKIFNIRVFQPETGGHIEVNGQTGTSFDYPYGTQIKIESVPDSGYEVARLDVSKDTDLYSVTIDADNANVALSPDKPGSEGKYYAGTTISYTVTPNSGYDITSVTVNENSEAAASGSWVINYDSTITVEASMQMVNIAVEQPANGRIEVNGEVGTSFDFPKGASGITIQAFANEGYQVEGLYVTNLDEQTQSLDETSTQAIDNVIDTTAEVEDVDETPTIE